MSTVMWVSLGLSMAISICATLYLAVRKTMQMLMADRKYDRIDVDRSDDLDKPGGGTLVFSPRYGNHSSQLVSSRKSTDSGRIMSGILATIIPSPTTAGHHAEK